jgi:alpha-aminoadipate carrier protein LysW
MCKLVLEKGAQVKARNEMVLCPECDTDLDLDEDEIEEGDVVSCAECGTEFSVITADPIELRPASDEDDEDEDEDEEDEEDEE